MPTYDYECSSCDKKFSFQRSMAEKDPGYLCTTCDKSLSRVYSSIGITFNGSGFYKTDNRK
jgi:putative FmdB family regulatory protein